MPFTPRSLRRVLAALVAGVVLAATPASATNDSLWPQQWAPEKVGAPAAWSTSTGAGVKIGIVDTGVDLTHPDLQNRVAAHTSCLRTGGSPSACTGSGQDDAGHGTHVAGIAVANKDNGIGIAGIAPDATLVVARVFEGDTAELADVNAGIKWVVDRGARVVNLSLGEGGLLSGLFGSSGSLSEGVEYAWSRGAIPVLAAGNSNFFGLGSANYGDANAVVVGATGRSDEVASYSSPTGNAKWAVAAPGGNSANGGNPAKILSTYFPDDYGLLEGTSMAAPHVSGALALLLALPGIGQQRAVDLILSTADRRVACGSTCVGRLAVGSAVAAAGGQRETPTTVATTSPPAGTAAPTTAPRARRAQAPTTTAAPRVEATPSTETVPAEGPAPAADPPPADPVLEEAAPVLTTPAAASGAGDKAPVGPLAAVAALALLGVAGWAGALARRRRAA